MFNLPFLASSSPAAGGLFPMAFADSAGGEGDIALPPPSHKGKRTLEELLKARRKQRGFPPGGITLEQLAQLLWAADGVSGKRRGQPVRTAPSGGALYPLDVYAVAGEGCVEGLAAGVYRYRPVGHRLERVREGEARGAVARAGLSQEWMGTAPVLLVITGEYARSMGKYGERGVIYTRIEAGHVGQNVFLQAEALGLKAGIVGSFKNAEVIEAMGIPAAHDPLLIMPVGRPE